MLRKAILKILDYFQKKLYVDSISNKNAGVHYIVSLKKTSNYVEPVSKCFQFPQSVTKSLAQIDYIDSQKSEVNLNLL